MYITMIFLYFSSKWGADQLGGKSLAYTAMENGDIWIINPLWVILLSFLKRHFLSLSVTDIARTNHIQSPDFVVVSQVRFIRRKRGGGFVFTTIDCSTINSVTAEKYMCDTECFGWFFFTFVICNCNFFMYV